MSPLPEGLDDPGDTNAPLYQDEDPPVAPVADPTADMDAFSDNDSVLSEVDEAQFEDFDPTNIAIEDRPAIPVDEDTVKSLKAHKRKRDGDDGAAVKKKKKEGRREKPKKKRKDSDDDDFSGGQEIEGKRKRKTKAITEGVSVGRRRLGREGPHPKMKKPWIRKNVSSHLAIVSENDWMLRNILGRRRALDRAMDAAVKNPSRRRRRGDGIVYDLTFLPIELTDADKGPHHSS